ncbi:hypothetical protein PF005_g20538 [Phytophthora fragariae]|uniref:Uncharacterized protein n=1 Tax=Phytophthora fragariae TaxID=53985 RepID=A0A6A4CRP7_9STRA|nr:hypothetical protein PF009_g21461 [Phytophthora fragariae]KAE8994507.1 hypothetical protein PF011_g16707 [Phytophthora fragariae]KAE9088623.1 hypothetical protein PF007_g19909 [Phytophthora fragariae]KAE9101028.1 hypothetical protein PF010_g14588 [Phytophthora fragariae]KAE9151756.1 hypothetical protein PF006_g3988 [Phytophthora fragariae]
MDGLLVAIFCLAILNSCCFSVLLVRNKHKNGIVLCFWNGVVLEITTQTTTTGSNLGRGDKLLLLSK